MITRDVSLEGFTAADWVRLSDVLRAPERAQVADDRPAGGVVAVVSAGRLRKLLHTRRGRLEFRDQAWPVALSELAKAQGARWAIQISSHALGDLADRFAARLRRNQEYLDQGFELWSALCELEAEGEFVTWPRRLSSFSVPSAVMRSIALDLFCADGCAVALGVFEQGELYTGIVARRRGPGFERIVGPEELRPAMGLLSGDFRRDHRHFTRAAESHVAPLALGCFGELQTFQRLCGEKTPGAWAAAVAARDIVLSPASPGVAVPLGIDVGRAALASLRGLVARAGGSEWLKNGPFGPLFGRAQEFVAKDISGLLGFNPWQLIVKLFERDAHDD